MASSHDDGSMNKTYGDLEMIAGVRRAPVDDSVLSRFRGARSTARGAPAFAVRPLPDGPCFAEAARLEGLTTSCCFQIVRHASGRGDLVLCSRSWPRDARRGAGQPPAVGPRHRERTGSDIAARRLRARSVIRSYFLSLACLNPGTATSRIRCHARALRAADALDPSRFDRKSESHPACVPAARKAEILELPVRFFPLSPDRVKRTSALDGLQALWILLAERLAPARQADRRQDYAGDAAPVRPAK